MSNDQEVLALFKAAAEKDGKSLRQWCRDNGIVYETLVGREIPSVTPLSAVHDHENRVLDYCPVCSEE